MARKKTASETKETQYWLSYSDMMAGLLLVFVLIISFSMMYAKQQYEEKEKQLIIQESLAKEKELIVEKQQKLVEEQKEIMGRQQAQLDDILGVRSKLVSALRDEFNGTELKVTVDPQTGAITFDSSVLFDTGKSDIKETGREFLSNFLPRYFSVLMKPEYRKYIAEIIIEGHTDTKGSYIYNLELSQQRSLSVATFCLEEGRGIVAENNLEELRKIVTANGRSFSNPVRNDDGTVNMDASRRVELKFRLKDDEMVSEMAKILEEDGKKY